MSLFFLSFLLYFFFMNGQLGYFDPYSPASANNKPVGLLVLFVCFAASLIFLYALRKWMVLGPVLVGAFFTVWACLEVIWFINGWANPCWRTPEHINRIHSCHYQLPIPLSDQFWILAVAFLIGIFIGLKIAYFVFILLKSFLSSYLLVRGLSLYIGGFPDEMKFITSWFDGSKDSSTGYTQSTQIYIGSLLVLFLILAVRNWKVLGASNEKEFNGGDSSDDEKDDKQEVKPEK